MKRNDFFAFVVLLLFVGGCGASFDGYDGLDIVELAGTDYERMDETPSPSPVFATMTPITGKAVSTKYLDLLEFVDADADADGVSMLDGDCDDADDTVNPDATETCNGLDDDCDKKSESIPAILAGDSVGYCEGRDASYSSGVLYTIWQDMNKPVGMALNSLLDISVAVQGDDSFTTTLMHDNTVVTTTVTQADAPSDVAYDGDKLVMASTFSIRIANGTADPTKIKVYNTYFPQSITADSSGNIYVSEYLYPMNRIVKLTKSAGYAETELMPWAERYIINMSYHDGKLLMADGCTWLQCESDTMNSVFSFDLANGDIEILAGTGETYEVCSKTMVNNAMATDTPICQPTSVIAAMENGKTVYYLTEISKSGSGGLVRKIQADGKLVTVAGGGTVATDTGTGIAPLSAKLSSPWDLAIDSMGNLYVAEQVNSTYDSTNPDAAYGIRVLVK